MNRTLATLNQDLIKAAEDVCKKAYAPYSHYFVGAAVLTDSGEIYTGCNVENASFGLTVCAERHAIANAVSKEGATPKIQAIAVVAAKGETCTPCGACRQVIAEFGHNIQVIYKDGGQWKDSPISAFLPGSFDFKN